MDAFIDQRLMSPNIKKLTGAAKAAVWLSVN